MTVVLKLEDMQGCPYGRLAQLFVVSRLSLGRVSTTRHFPWRTSRSPRSRGYFEVG